MSQSKEENKIIPQHQKYYDPNYFYEHGANPAWKNLMSIMVENTREGSHQDYRTFVTEKKKLFMARGLEDFFERDLVANTFLRSFAMFGIVTAMTLRAIDIQMRMLPVGKNGVTKISQTRFYRIFGPIGAAAVTAMTMTSFYIWYRTSIWTAKKFYHHVILQERNWIHEYMTTFKGGGNYMFFDTPMSSIDSIPGPVWAEMAKKEVEVPEFAEKTFSSS